MKLALTAIVISALIFIVGYKMLENESDQYKTHIETNLNDALR
jgi:hypothetical protein